MCETSDDEDDEDKVEEKIEDVAEDNLEYEESKAQEPEAGEEVIDHKEDKIIMRKARQESLKLRERSRTLSLLTRRKRNQYRMDKSSQGAEWMWDEQVLLLIQEIHVSCH
ncbi:hypothetical protein MHU86_23653 [Fragilaria crotonensis]|nr:hypothetical protein MHU86_23653 [Fragilaria crotonensis]